jgi:hypothetical protein
MSSMSATIHQEGVGLPFLFFFFSTMRVGRSGSTTAPPQTSEQSFILGASPSSAFPFCAAHFRFSNFVRLPIFPPLFVRLQRKHRVMCGAHGVCAEKEIDERMIICDFNPGILSFHSKKKKAIVFFRIFRLAKRFTPPSRQVKPPSNHYYEPLVGSIRIHTDKPLSTRTISFLAIIFGSNKLYFYI